MALKANAFISVDFYENKHAKYICIFLIIISIQSNNSTTQQPTTNQSVTGPYHTSIQNSHHQQMEATSQPSIIDQTNHSHMSNAFNHTTPSGATVSGHQNQSSQSNIKVEKRPGDKSAKKNDKRFLCCYCSWSGNDNWGLKRHLNTHTKPFVCGLCDYKAARSERLATHVFKVHNKKVCTKCNYLAENQTEYDAHVNTTQYVQPHFGFLIARIDLNE